MSGNFICIKMLATSFGVVDEYEHSVRCHAMDVLQALEFALPGHKKYLSNMTFYLDNSILFYFLF